MIWKSIFSAVGLCSLIWVLSGYGFTKIGTDILSLGWWAIPLSLSYGPVVLCYALAWLCITPQLELRHLRLLFRYSMISVAWNNLSPFVKVLGEPMRVVMLENLMSRKDAARSMVLYNIVHILGTLLAFFVGALATLILYPVSEGFRVGFIALLVASPLLTLLLFSLPRLVKHLGRSARRNKLVYAGFWLRWSFSKIRIFSRSEPKRFWAAVGLEILARFVEGLTFYIAFQALGQPASALACSLLDVGRALMDNIFFFIPYQVGSREGGIVLMAEHALHISGNVAVSAAVLYRLVEIFWMGMGYLLWISAARERKSST